LDRDFGGFGGGGGGQERRPEPPPTPNPDPFRRNLSSSERAGAQVTDLELTQTLNAADPGGGPNAAAAAPHDGLCTTLTLDMHVNHAGVPNGLVPFGLEADKDLRVRRKP